MDVVVQVMRDDVTQGAAMQLGLVHQVISLAHFVFSFCALFCFVFASNAFAVLHFRVDGVW